VLFIDIGASAAQFSLVQFVSVAQVDRKGQPLNNTLETVRIVLSSFAKDVGGLAYDRALADHFASEIDAKEQTNVSIKEDAKVMIKLMLECTRVKEILSSNKEAVIHVLGLYENKDFTSEISRATFEEIAKNLTLALLAPLARVLKGAEEVKLEIHVVELVGGGARVPMVQSFLKQALPKDLQIGQHLNGDESMALGAGIMAANYNTFIKSRQINLIDGYDFAVKAEIRSLDRKSAYSQNLTLFESKAKFGSMKIVTLNFVNALKVDIFAEKGSEREPLASYKVLNISNQILKSKKNYDTFNTTKINLQFVLSSTQGVVHETKALLTV